MPLGYNGVLEYNENGAVAMYAAGIQARVKLVTHEGGLRVFCARTYCSGLGVHPQTAGSQLSDATQHDTCLSEHAELWMVGAPWARPGGDGLVTRRKTVTPFRGSSELG